MKLTIIWPDLETTSVDHNRIRGLTRRDAAGNLMRPWRIIADDRPPPHILNSVCELKSLGKSLRMVEAFIPIGWTNWPQIRPELVQPFSVAVLVGNSDDRLTQGQWSHFLGRIRYLLERDGKVIHFEGCSHGDRPWQNACFVSELESMADYDYLRSSLALIGRDYSQYWIAVVGSPVDYIKCNEDPKAPEPPKTVRDASGVEYVVACPGNPSIQ